MSCRAHTRSRPCFKELELTGYLEELSGALAVSPRREFKGFPQGAALQLHQVEGSPKRQDREQVLHSNGACGRNSVTLSATNAIFLSFCSVVGRKQLTVPTALIDRGADPASVQDGGTDVVPLDIVRVSDVIVDLKY